MKNARKIMTFVLTFVATIMLTTICTFAETKSIDYSEKILVKVVWDDEDNYDGLRKGGEVKVIGKNGLGAIGIKKIENLDVNKDEQTFCFTGLPVKGNFLIYKDLSYSLEYPDYMSGYTINCSKEGNLYTITYKHEVQKRNITVNAKWDDEDNADGFRKDISFSLYRKAGGQEEVVGNETIYASDNQKEYEFNDLRTYYEGKKCTYDVRLNERLDVYQKKIYNVNEDCNKIAIDLNHTVQKATVKAVKFWDDLFNKNNIRPTAVVLELFADGESTGQRRTLTSTSKIFDFNHDILWDLAKWEDLPMYKNGVLIKYTVKEVVVPDFYKSEYVDNIYNLGIGIPGLQYDRDWLAIKNTYDGAQTEVKVQIVWDDDSNAYSTRPENVSLQLKQNGNDKGEARSITTVGADTFSETFSNLPLNYDGKKATYTVEQNNVDGYTTTRKEKDGKIIITNSLNVRPSVEPSVSPTSTSSTDENQSTSSSSDTDENQSPSSSSDTDENQSPSSSSDTDENQSPSSSSDTDENQSPSSSSDIDIKPTPNQTESTVIVNPTRGPLQPNTSVAPTDEVTVSPTTTSTVEPTKEVSESTPSMELKESKEPCVLPTNSNKYNVTINKDKVYYDSKTDKNLNKTNTAKNQNYMGKNDECNNIDATPTTGDNSNIILWFTILIITVGILITFGIMILRSKKKE